MTFLTRQVEAQFYELCCDHCQKGVYRHHPVQDEHDYDSIDIHCNPTTWKMRCHQCGHETWFGVPAPYLVYRGKRFVLYDSVDDKLNTLKSLLRRVVDSRSPTKTE